MPLTAPFRALELDFCNLPPRGEHSVAFDVPVLIGGRGRGDHGGASTSAPADGPGAAKGNKLEKGRSKGGKGGQRRDRNQAAGMSPFYRIFISSILSFVHWVYFVYFVTV